MIALHVLSVALNIYVLAVISCDDHCSRRSTSYQARLNKLFDLGQRVFQMPSNGRLQGVCKGFAKHLQRVWKKFEMLVKGFVKRLKGFGRSL